MRIGFAVLAVVLAVAAPGFSQTYEEIMAEIAQYPGPDEPMYKPSPEEAIWLTDLEGHADIYDNDSIKINYADWFDQSQVTRIEVYRNGIKMLFLPDMIDVLTNDQMKTFDGNRYEHSPASRHTDHAIWGYSYEFRFQRNEGTEFHLLSMCVRNPITYRGDAYVHIGQTWQCPWGFPDTSDEVLRASLATIKSLGFEGIGLDSYVYMEDEYSSSIFRNYEPDNNVHFTITPNEAILRHVIRLAKSEGLKIWLRLQVQVANEYKNSVSHFVWRGSISPANVSAWFESYAAECLRLAAIAEEEDVETFCIAVELTSMQEHVQHWGQLAESVREVFGGQVTMDEATNHHLVGPACENEPFSWIAGRQWNAFDRIEMNYWQIPSCLALSDGKDQRFSVMVERYVRFWEPAFTHYRRQYPNIPIAYGENGHFTCDGTVIEGWWSGEGGPTDHQEASDVWATYMIAARYFSADAIAAWTWSLNRIDEITICDGGDLNGMPAGNVVASFLPHAACYAGPFNNLVNESIQESYLAVDSQAHDSEETSPDDGTADHYVLRVNSEVVNQSLEEQLENEATGKPLVTIRITVRAKGKQDNELPVLVVMAHGQTLIEFEALTFDTWRDYAFEVELPASPAVFSVGMARPQRGNQVSIDWVAIDGKRYEVESLPEYGLIGAAPELDPTYITFWEPGRIAWVVDLSE